MTKRDAGLGLQVSARSKPNGPSLIDETLSNPDNSLMENTMKTIEPAHDQEQADSQEIMRLACEGKRVTDPELRRRVRERAEKVRKEIFDRHGIVDWAVDMIRDARDE